VGESRLHSQRCGEYIMNIQHYKQRLLDLEKDLAARIGQETEQGRGEFIDSAHDVGDASVADEVASEVFTETEHNADVLQQVRDALGRVDDGTFGACIVDGGPIEEQRLEAVPWTPYCLKHAQRREVAAAAKTPTLYVDLISDLEANRHRHQRAARLVEKRRHHEGVDRNRDVGDVGTVRDDRVLGSGTEASGGPVGASSRCCGG